MKKTSKNYPIAQDFIRCARQAKADKWADTLCKTPNGVMTRREFYSINLVGKEHEVERYAKRKVKGQYAMLANPKDIYYLVYSEGGEFFFRDVPKSFWDTVTAVDWKKVKEGINDGS